MLIVLEIAPEMNDWAAAIMVMWLSTIKKPLALLAARVGTVKNVVVLVLEMRCTFQGHGAANVVVGGFDICSAKTQGAQQVKGRIVQLFGWDAQHLRAEFLAQRPLVEHKADVKGACQRGIHLGQLIRAKAVPASVVWLMPGALPMEPWPTRIADDLFDLGRAIAQVLKRRGTDWLMILK